MSEPSQVRAGCDVKVCSEPSHDWDPFLDAVPSAPVYLQSRWSLAAREAFGHEAYFLEARVAGGRLVGVLPLIRQRSRIVGNFLTSLPFFNYGGALAESKEIAERLMTQAVLLGKATGCKYVEFRDREPREGDWLCRMDKVTMIRELPHSDVVLARDLGSKLRAQVKRATREGAEVHAGGAELLDDFYRVFAANMHDLGTPVYPKRFFECLLMRAPEACRLICVRRSGQVAAAAFLITHNRTTEIPWASCLSFAKPLGFNMRLYWEALCAAIELGADRFDFGRSTIDSGTYRFKKQWGAQPLQLYWHRWAQNPAPKSEKLARLTAIWQRLPLPVANTLGPWVSPYLPW